jgi:predicted transposase/invertase (TIGR01784 family)
MKTKKQASQYDKVFKENIEAAIPSIIRNLLGINAVSSEELPDDVIHTKERKPDVLKKIIDSQGEIFVLQIEFQVADEPEMIYRMLEYYAMLERKYKVPIKQFVIFLGSSIPKMATQIKRERLKFNFPLISLIELDYKIFLRFDKPEEIILAVLANFERDNPKNALKKIIQRIEETTEGDFALKRYFKQLGILSQLRSLDMTLKEITMDNIAKYINEDKDVAYLIGIEKGVQKGIQKGIEKGIEKGMTKGQETFILNLLIQTDFSLDKIANLAGSTVEFVKQVKKKQSSKK